MEIVKMNPEPLPEFPNKPKAPVTFTPEEWCYFVQEVEMRQGKDIEKCINNARYLAELDRSRAGEFGVKMSLAELEALING